jgi:hypothetical protein
MNIQLLFQALTPEEKKELYQCFSGNEIKAHRATISDFINISPNTMVNRALCEYKEVNKATYIDEVNIWLFLRCRNTGKKTWYDFQELLKDRR